MLAPSTTQRLLTVALLAAPFAAGVASAQPTGEAPAAPASPSAAPLSAATSAAPVESAAPPAPEAPEVDDETGPYRTPEYIQNPATLPPSQAGARAIRLRLDDALALALQRNLDLLVQRLGQRAAEADARAQRGAFEPTFNAGYAHSLVETPPSTVQEGQASQIGRVRTNTWSAGVLQRLRTGTTLQLNFDNAWTRSTLGNAVAPDLYRSHLGVSISQPLLRGFSLDTEIPSNDVIVAELNSQHEIETTRVAVANTIQGVEKAYWDLVQDLKIYEIKATSAERARRQLELTERQIDAGLLPPSDHIDAEGTLATRRFALVQAEADIADSMDDLRRRLRVPPEQWSEPIVPAEMPRFADMTLDLPALLARAARQRPELRQRALESAQARRERRKRNNDLLPDLEVGAGYGVVGQDATYGRALDNMAAARGREWSAFVNFSWAPLGFEARGRAEQQNLLVEKAEVAERGQGADVALEVRGAVRAVATAARQVRAAAKTRRLAEGSLDAEQRKFMTGQSSNFLVAQRQDNLTNANIAELTAVVNHAKALVDLWRATGDLLQQNNVRLTAH